jgi:hypothetical protein
VIGLALCTVVRKSFIRLHSVAIETYGLDGIFPRVTFAFIVAFEATIGLHAAFGLKQVTNIVELVTSCVFHLVPGSNGTCSREKGIQQRRLQTNRRGNALVLPS